MTPVCAQAFVPQSRGCTHVTQARDTDGCCAGLWEFIFDFKPVTGVGVPAAELVKEEEEEEAATSEGAFGEVCCSMSFDTGVSTKTVFITLQPLGFTFNDEMPMVVNDVFASTEGCTAGVQIGWVLKSIDSITLENMSCAEARQLLAERTYVLPRRTTVEDQLMVVVNEEKSKLDGDYCDEHHGKVSETGPLPHSKPSAESCGSGDAPPKSKPSKESFGGGNSRLALTEREKPPNVTTKSPLLFIGAHILLLFLLFPVLLGIQCILRLIGRRGQDFVATFQVVLNIVNFVMACFSALNVGVLPQVAASSSAKNYTHIGRIFRVSLISCIVCGIMGSSSLLLLRDELFQLFSKESELEQMVLLGETMLVLMAVGFLPNLLQSSIATIYQGLGYMVQLMAVGFLQVVVAIVAIALMYDEYGLDAFGWGSVLGSCLACIIFVVYLVGISKNRHLHRFCAWSSSDFAAFKKILRALGWVSLRSVFNQLRTLIMVALVTRLGMLYGAIYPVLLLRKALSFGPCIVVGFFFTPFLCSRIWGYRLPDLALQLFTDYCKLGFFFTVLVALAFAVMGKDSLQQHVEDVVDEAKDAETKIIRPTIFVIFLAQCIFRSVVMLYDGACIAFDEVRGSGIAVFLSFIVFLIIALLGQDTFEILYLAELIYFAVRAGILHWYLLKLGWSPRKNFPNGISLKPEWQELLDQGSTKRWFFFPTRRVYLGYVTTCIAATFDSKVSDIEEWSVVGEAIEHMTYRAKDVNCETLVEKTSGDIVVGRREGQWLALTEESGYMLISDGDQVFLQCMRPSNVKDMVS